MRKFTDFDPPCKSAWASAFGWSKYQGHESQLAHLCGSVGLFIYIPHSWPLFFPFIQSSMSCCTHINCPEQTSCLFCFYHKCHSTNQPLGHAQVQWNLVFPSQTPSITSTPTSASVRPLKFFQKYSYCGWYNENFCQSKYIKTINIFRSSM